MPELLKVPVLYCDIDGTIRHGYGELGKFVNIADDVKVFDGVADLLWGYRDLGWRIIGISNQGGVALGHMTMAEALGAMEETQRQCRMAFDKINFCTHSPYDNPGCACRKPGTLMISEGRNWLQQRHGEEYPMEMALFVGDRPEDETCAANAGIGFLDAEKWRTGEHLKIWKDLNE